MEVHKLSGKTIDQEITYQYDNDEQLVSYEQKDVDGHIISGANYSKDAQGRTTQSQIIYGKIDDPGYISFSISQSFNADGHLASLTYPDGSSQLYYYQHGQIIKIILPNGSEISYQNYNWGIPTTIRTPGAVKNIVLDAARRPISIQVMNNSSQLLASRIYQYDKSGNIIQIDSDLGKTEYVYDKSDRLTQATPDASLQSLGLPQEQYSYDAVGNRISSAHQPGS